MCDAATASQSNAFSDGCSDVATMLRRASTHYVEARFRAKNVHAIPGKSLSAAKKWAASAFGVVLSLDSRDYA